LYSINAIDALWWNPTLSTWGYAVHKYVFNYGTGLPGVTYLNKTFTEARLEMVQNLSMRRGRTVTLTIDAATGQATRVDLQDLESVCLGAIETHGATTTISRGAFALETGRYPTRFDVDGLFFDSDKFDLTTQLGEFGVWWLSSDGWHLKRALPVTGVLAKVSTGVYSIAGVTQPYEADCSRFNLTYGSRPTQFYNSYTRLGLTALKATAWCVPDTGSPIGFTYDSAANAKAALLLGITNATAAKNAVTESLDGAGLASGTRWATPTVMSTFGTAIAAAQTVYDAATDSSGINYLNAIYALAEAMQYTGNDTTAYKGFLPNVQTVPVP
jgi:hypothetical protein